MVCSLCHGVSQGLTWLPCWAAWVHSECVTVFYSKGRSYIVKKGQ